MPDVAHRSPPSLAGAEWLTRASTKAVFRALTADGAEARTVGGALRNALLGLPVGEIDIATTALPNDVVALAGRAGLKAVPTGIAHGTVTVIADGIPFEVTTLRRDVETYGRHAKVAFTNVWEEDAKRRDFTLNALYAGADGTVYDPLGGLADLLARRVRFIGDAEARIREDYLRILRFFRFHADYGRGQMDQAGLLACVRLRDGLERLSPERVWTEFRRLLVARQASTTVANLFDYGLLVPLLGGVPRLLDFESAVAIEDAQGLKADAPLRLAALGVFVAEDVERLAQHFRLSNTERDVLRLAVLGGTTKLSDESVAKGLLYKLGGETFTQALRLAWARSGAAAADPVWREALTLPERWTPPPFPLRGEDIIALGAQGPEIGEVLRRIEAEWVAADFAPSREQLLAAARRLIAS